MLQGVQHGVNTNLRGGICSDMMNLGEEYPDHIAHQIQACSLI
jgi:hypothetical protein